MAENKATPENQALNDEYTAVGEEIIRQQDLAPQEAPATPQGEPVQEDPRDDAIYKDAPADPVPAKPAAVGEYESFSAAAAEAEENEAPAFLATDGDVPAPEVTEPDAPASETADAKAAPEAKKDSAEFREVIIRPVIALLVICLITSLLLALTNGLTEPIIKANAEAVAEQARVELLPAADGFEEIPVPEEMKSISSIYRATNDTGWIIGAFGRGYAGPVPALVAFDENGDIIGVTFTENSETVGLGQKVREPAFYEQFAGRPSEDLTLGDIDKIASATISTNAALSAVNEAIDAYHQVNGDGSSGTSPTDITQVLALLLPGQKLTPITISAQDVQPTAYRGENGEYIIFGEKAGDRTESGSVVVAGVAMDSEGNILNLWLDTSSEGYGKALATNSAFIHNFIGQSAPAKVDAIADITGSSTAVVDAVNNALGALSLAKEAA